MSGKKENIVAANQVGDGLTIPEIMTAGAIETENDFGVWNMDAVQLEAFMHEKVQILVFESQSEEDLPMVDPSVGGIRQPIVRGVPTWVKRKYIEALARSVRSSYVQRRRDPGDPASLMMVPTHRQCYPFTVIQDPNPNGRAWLEALKQERV
jgi:hypothetical protein